MSRILYDGILVDAHSAMISHRDGGFAFGLGIFDTALVIDGELQHADLHFKRLNHDAKTILDHTPYASEAGFIADIRTLLAHENLTEGRVRVRTSVYGGPCDKPLLPVTAVHILIQAAPAPDIADLPPIKAVITGSYPKQAGNPLENCKRLDYTGAYLARRLAESHNCNEALLTNTLGHVVCATTSNLFIEDENGKWITPPLSEGALNGTMRSVVMKEKTVFEAPLSVADIMSAPAVYLTNAITGVRKIESLKNLIRQKT